MPISPQPGSADFANTHDQLIRAGYTVVNVPGRPAHLPTIYLFPHGVRHSQRNEHLTTGKDYLILISSTKEWMTWKLEVEGSIGTPKGRQQLSSGE